jgi:hypothetical protein
MLHRDQPHPDKVGEDSVAAFNAMPVGALVAWASVLIDQTMISVAVEMPGDEAGVLAALRAAKLCVADAELRLLASGREVGDEAQQ